MKVLIVGGVAGGASTATRLRRQDEKAEIIIFEKDEFISFANCGLPYYIGGVIKERDSLILQTPDGFKKKYNIEVRVNQEVISIDKEKKEIKILNRVTKKEYVENYDKLILSTGAAPLKLPIKGIESEKIFTLRNIADVTNIKNYIDKEKPKTAVVAGGGYIGIEVCENLKEAGLDVTILELADAIMPPLDIEMSQLVKVYLEQQGIKLFLNEGIKEILENKNELEILTTENNKLKADMIIMSVGVRPEAKIAKDAGLEINKLGTVVVNENMITSDSNIYALGDVAQVINIVTKKEDFLPLAGPANKQARIVADNIVGSNKKYIGSQGSSIIKVFEMTVANTGINEKKAKVTGMDYDKIYLFPNSSSGYYPGSEEISIKIIFEKVTGKILGGQFIGFKGVDKRCDVLATVIRFGGTATDLSQLELCYAPPFNSPNDPVNVAGNMIENILNGSVKTYHWDEVDTLLKNGSVNLIDARTNDEYKLGHINGFINIPLTELRDRLGELDKEKPVYLHCLSGTRSYVACRFLTNEGFDCYSLSGGPRIYNLMKGHLKGELKIKKNFINYDRSF